MNPGKGSEPFTHSAQAEGFEMLEIKLPLINNLARRRKRRGAEGRKDITEWSNDS